MMLQVGCLTVLCVCLLLLDTVFADVCPYKECPCAWPDIFCQQLGLVTMPSLANTETSGFGNLILDSNQITTIPVGCLPLNLSEISFSHNPITTIDENAFEGSTSTLQTVTFAEARLTRFPDAFLHLRNLKYLNVYNTDILDWNIDAMKNIGQTIHTLYLENVSLSTWPVWIQHFSQLSLLTILDSSISFIPDDAFEEILTNLQGLTISKGSLVSIPKALAKLPALESLDLQYNKIIDITFIPRLSNLTSLALEHNKISDADHLSNALRPFANSLVSIQLDHNLLTAIPNVSFLINIGGLSLSNNQISDSNSGAVPLGLNDFDLTFNLLPSIPSLWPHLKTVSSLTLSHNSVTRIEGKDFHSSTFEVNLEHNLVTELTDGSFPLNSSIVTMFFKGNPMIRISANAFKNLPHLMTLDLQGTKLTRLPLDLLSLTSLNSLDLSSSANLVCTCTEKDLGPWIRSREEVKGDCGLISIQQFFTTLSPDCPDS